MPEAPLSVCFYAQMHRPPRLRHTRVFDETTEFLDEVAAAQDLRQATTLAWMPALDAFEAAAAATDGTFKFALSVSGWVLKRAPQVVPNLIERLRALHEGGVVHFVAEPVNRSLTSVLAESTFGAEAAQHRDLVEEVLGDRPRAVANTELIYDNRIAREAEEQGFEVILAGSADRFLAGRSADHPYRPVGCRSIAVLPRNTGLSDDLNIRFSDPKWPCYPLSADTFAGWIKGNLEDNRGEHGAVLPLMTDLASFGGRHRADSGIFEFLQALMIKLVESGVSFASPREVGQRYPVDGPLDVPFATSWLPTNNDLAPMLGNAMQSNALLEWSHLRQLATSEDVADVRRVLEAMAAADHFLRMSTAHAAGSASAAGSDAALGRTFESEGPYDAYITYMNLLDHLRRRLRHAGKA